MLAKNYLDICTHLKDSHLLEEVNMTPADAAEKFDAKDWMVTLQSLIRALDGVREKEVQGKQGRTQDEESRESFSNCDDDEDTKSNDDSSMDWDDDEEDLKSDDDSSKDSDKKNISVRIY